MRVEETAVDREWINALKDRVGRALRFVLIGWSMETQASIEI
jgi:hypothetical protein